LRRPALVARIDLVREWVVPAVGVALSPLPILGMLLVLGGRRPVVHGAAFWGAWTIGVAAPTIAFVVVAERSGAINDDPVAIAVAEIALGAVFLAVAGGLVLGRRPGPSDDAPHWLDALDRAGPTRAAALALVLSSGNPKNLALMLAAAVAIAQEGRLALGAAGFVLLAASTVSLLLVGYTAFAGRSRPALARLRNAVARNDRRIAMLVGLVVGAFFLLDGIRSL
jgi:threonine/homoserine/homoserine lactone efflux protein